jgi:transglutaminase-like putative cysteine protease
VRLALLAGATVLAATLGLGGVFAKVDWIGGALVAVISAFAVGAIARRLGAGGVITTVAHVVTFVLLISIGFFRHTTALGIPTTATWKALRAALRLAGDDLQDLSPPVPTLPHLVLLATAALYVVSAVVDDLVFRARRVAVVGLPLLALYVVPASLAPKGVGFVSFALAATAYCALLLTENGERVGRWGKRMSLSPLGEDYVDLRPLTRMGWRLSSAAVGLAVVVPLLVPNLGHGFLVVSGGFGSGEGNGPSSIQVISPIVSLEANLRESQEVELLAVRTDTPQKLRLTVLDNFDGRDWTQSDLTGGKDHRVDDGQRVPSPPGTASAPLKTVRTEVEVGPLDQHWLPVPYSPSTVTIDGDWRYDSASLTIFSARTTTLGKSYTVESSVPTPTRAQLSKAEAPVITQDLERYIRLPGGVSPYVQNVLNRLVAGKKTPLEQVLAIQKFLRSPPFSYNTNVTLGRGSDDIERFLRGHVGFCEQYAATMAYLVRLLGLPSRIAIGFVRPSLLRPDGRLRISNHDAHAWPEVYFEGFGWIEFEPTPRNDALTPEPDYAVTSSTGLDGGGDQGGPRAEPTDAAGEPSAAPAPAGGNGGQALPPSSTGGGGGSGGVRGTLASAGVVVGAATVVLVLLMLPYAVRLLTRRRRRQRAADPVGLAHAAWCDAMDDAEDAGYGPLPHESPRRTAARVVEEAALQESASRALRELAAYEERARYARSVEVDEELDIRVMQLRRGLLGGLTRWQRVRVVLLPMSTARRMRSAMRLRRNRGLQGNLGRARA